MAQSFTGKVEIQPDGDVKMYTKPTAPGAEPDRDYKIYQRRGRKDWLPTRYNHQVALDWVGIAWMEEEFGELYEQTVSIPGESLSDTKVQDGKATTIFYKAAMFALLPGRGVENIIPYMYNNKEQGPVPARVTYVHSVVDGKLGKMLEFHLAAFDPVEYNNNWLDNESKLGKWDTESGGWPYDTDDEGELSRPAEPGAKYSPSRGDSNIYQIGWPLKIDPKAEIVNDSDLPFLNIKTETQSNGNFVETIWDKGRTQAIQFVYRKEDRKDLIQQTIGHMENSNWVQTTTRSEDLFKWVDNRIKVWAKDHFFVVYDPNTFEGSWTFTSPTIHWDIDTNPEFQQNWIGQIWLRLKKGKTIDGIDQYSLENIRHSIEWGRCRNDGLWNFSENQPMAKKKGMPSYKAPPGLPWDWLTEYDLESVVTRWNEIVAPLPEQH